VWQQVVRLSVVDQQYKPVLVKLNSQHKQLEWQQVESLSVAAQPSRK
jgi:hypothetical protein